MVVDVNQTSHGDHFTIYINIKALHCMPETNIMLHVNYNSKQINTMVGTDFNQQCTITIGKSMQRELKSGLICTEMTGCFKGGIRDQGGMSRGSTGSEK